MIDTFLMFFPACAMFVTMAFIVCDEWRRQDARIKRGLLLRLTHAQQRELARRGDVSNLTVYQEDGQMLCHIDMKTYFDELPVVWPR